MIAVNFNLYICLDTFLGKIITFLKNEAKTIEERSLKCSCDFFFIIVIYQDLDFRASK